MAKVQGVCLAGAGELLGVADLAIAATDAKIQEYAQMFAEEEHEHAAAAKRKLDALTQGEKSDHRLDLDPPVMPE